MYRCEGVLCVQMCKVFSVYRSIRCSLCTGVKVFSVYRCEGVLCVQMCKVFSVYRSVRCSLCTGV